MKKVFKGVREASVFNELIRIVKPVGKGSIYTLRLRIVTTGVAFGRGMFRCNVKIT